RCRDRRRVLTQANLHDDAAAGERVAQVLRLGRPLRGPADHADLAYPLERVGELRKEVAAAAHDALAPAGEADGLDDEMLAGEGLPAHASTSCRMVTPSSVLRPVISMVYSIAWIGIILSWTRSNRCACFFTSRGLCISGVPAWSVTSVRPPSVERSSASSSSWERGSSCVIAGTSS